MSDVAVPPQKPHHQSRLELVRRTVVFQLKLAADGVLDLLLSPMSLLAALAGLIAGGDEPDRYLRQVQYLGHRADRWINLFNQYRGGENADALLAALEGRLKDKYARRGTIPPTGDSTAPPPATSVKDDRPS